MAPESSTKSMLSSLKTRASSFRSQRSGSNMSDTSQATVPPSLPLPEISHPFPVVEQPARIILTSLDSQFSEQRLTSTRKGVVQVSNGRSDAMQFLLIPVDTAETGEASDPDDSVPGTSSADADAADASGNTDDAAGAAGVETAEDDAEKHDACGKADDTAGAESEGVAEDAIVDGASAGAYDEQDELESTKRTKRKDIFYLRSYKFNRYLTSDSTGVLSTIDLSKNGENGQPLQPGNAEEWILMKSPHGGHFLVSAKNELNIACLRGESVKIGLKGDNDLSESWEVEFVSGELCFLSSAEDKRIRCDLMGKLSLTTEQRGWEVWRFIEMGNGKVRIVSWMHSQFCIACNHEGQISTLGIGKADEGCDEWTVEKAPDEYSGVVIRSVACARRILCHGDEGLTATQELEGESSIWQLDAAHSQNYIMTLLHHNRSIGPFPYVTENMKQSDQLVLQQIDDEGTVRLYHKSRGQYLVSEVENEVSLTSTTPEDTEASVRWKMEQRSDGGYTFTSKSHGGLLALSDDEINPQLCTVSEITDDNREVWGVNPILPRAISSGKIKTFAIGTSIAVGTTVAMPFLMAGMLAVVPAEATLVASVLSVGLTGAEAIASVGAIGATAAIVFREASDTLGIESEHDDNEDAHDYTKRPLCAWRSW